MKYRKFKTNELNDARNRAQFIRQMPSQMRPEVLDMFKDMAQGGDGGGAYGKSVRETYESYRDKHDTWFCIKDMFAIV